MDVFFEIPGLNVYIQIIVTLISIAVQRVASRGKGSDSLVTVATHLTFGLSGWFTIMSGLFGHIIYADQVAVGIGWPQDSGFQMELGFASIGIGIVGLFGFRRTDYWLPFIILKTCFGWGAGFTHILHPVQHGNFSAGNVGIILYWDFLFPLVLIALYTLYRRQPGPAPAHSPG
jgi:hypothetical protein